MKKLILYAVFSLILLASCSSDENMLQAEISEPEMQSGGISAKRTVDEAADIAFSAIDMLPRCKSRSGVRSFNKGKVKIIGSAQSRSGGSDTLMYVFNFDDEEGFAVVAADRAFSEGLIAVTEKGSYDPSVTPENPGLALYMKSAESYLAGLDLKEAIKVPIDTIINPGFAEYKIVRDTTYLEIIDPSFDLLWGQEYPEGWLFDNGMAGCVNTVCLIAMSYFNTPTQITLDYNASGEQMNIDWDAIHTHRVSVRNGSIVTDDCTNEVHMTIAKICKELSDRNHSFPSLNPYGTYTSFPNAKFTLDGLGLHTYPVTSGMPSSTTIAKTMRDGGIILMSAAGEFPDKDGNPYIDRHAFVLDGIKYYDIHVGEWIREWGKPWVLSNDHGTSRYRYNHINWGWNGHGNGYFSGSVMDLGKPYKYDEPGLAADDVIINDDYMYLQVFK